MKISELATVTGVPLATIKLYQREHLLMPGEAITRTRSEYGSQHVERVRTIKTLAALPGYTYHVLRDLFGLIDDSTRPAAERISAAVPLLPAADTAVEHIPLALIAAQSLGLELDESTAVAGQFGASLASAEAVGMPCSDERLAFYWKHIRAIAEFELAGVKDTQNPNAAVQYAIVGTAVYEHLILSLRRLAHQQLFDPDQSFRP